MLWVSSSSPALLLPINLLTNWFPKWHYANTLESAALLEFLRCFSLLVGWGCQCSAQHLAWASSSQASLITFSSFLPLGLLGCWHFNHVIHFFPSLKYFPWCLFCHWPVCFSQILVWPVSSHASLVFTHHLLRKLLHMFREQPSLVCAPCSIGQFQGAKHTYS